MPRQMNPYLNRRAVTEPAEFHGRETITCELLQRLITSTSEPQSCLVLGMRRIGKSSLLNFLVHPDGARRRYPDYFPDECKSVMVTLNSRDINLLSETSAELVEKVVVRMMLKGLKRATQKEVAEGRAGEIVQSAIATAASESDRALSVLKASQLHERLEELLEALHDEGYRTLFLFDGIDDESLEWPESMARRLRYYFNSYSVGYVIASLRPITEVLERGRDSELFNVFNSIILGPLSYRGARGLLQDPLGRGDQEWPDDFVEALLAQVGTHPDLVKMAGAHAWSLRSSTGRNPEVATVLEAVRLDAERLYQSINRYLDDEQRAALFQPDPNLSSILLAGHAATDRGATLGRYFYEWLHQAAPDSGLPTLSGQQLTLDGAVVELTPVEREVIERLLANIGQPVTRQQLQSEIWSQLDEESKALDTTIQRLRAKLGDDPRDPHWIQTVRGVGYKLNRAF